MIPYLPAVRPFEAYTWQHALPIGFFLMAAFFVIRRGRQSSTHQQTTTGIIIASIVLAFMVGGSAIKLYDGSFDYKEDLPLYLCRIIAWMLPVVIWFRNRFWLGIFYFWILGGTLQGLVTPDLAEGFPNYFFFRYWFLHAGLVVVILYAVIVFRVNIRWKDFAYAVILAQVYIVFIYFLNVLIGSNYSYTLRKPPGPSVLDIMGPWPVYILAGEGMMVVLFLLLMLPWLKKQS